MILKEKETWILGTVTFAGLCIGIILGKTIDYEPDLLMRILLVIIAYLCWVMVIAFIKWGDRLLIEYRLFIES